MEDREEGSSDCPSWVPGITAKAWVARQKPLPPHTACSDGPPVSSSSSLPLFPTLVGHRLGERTAGKTGKKKKGKGPKCNDSPSFVLPWGFRGWTLEIPAYPWETLRYQLPGQQEDDSVYSKLTACHGNLGPVPLGLGAKVLDKRGGATCT